jgi:hypothetical protein
MFVGPGLYSSAVPSYSFFYQYAWAVDSKRLRVNKQKGHASGKVLVLFLCLSGLLKDKKDKKGKKGQRHSVL